MTLYDTAIIRQSACGNLFAFAIIQSLINQRSSNLMTTATKFKNELTKLVYTDSKQH